MKNLVQLIVFFLFFNTALFAQKGITAILGAFPAEVKMLQDSVEHPKVKVVEGIKFVSGILKGQKVVIAETGIGKVNAAMTTTLVIAVFKPERLIFTGIAGGLNPELNPGDIVIGKLVGYHDYHSVKLDATAQPTNQTINPVNKQFNPEFFEADKILLQKAETAAQVIDFMKIDNKKPTVKTGKIITGDIFVHSKTLVEQLWNDYQADATEMEGAAVAQVCFQQQLPLLVIRSLSDKADENARKDMLSFYKTAAANSAGLVKAILKTL